MVSDPMDMESVCQLPQKDHILFPEARSFDDLRHFCRKLKGDISAMTAETQPKIVESYRKVVPDPSGGKSNSFYSTMPIGLMSIFKGTFGPAGKTRLRRAST